MSARLVTKDETRNTMECEVCRAVASKRPWTNGWTGCGRSRRLLYASNEAKDPAVAAHWCPAHHDGIGPHDNPHVSELRRIRRNIEEGVMTTVYGNSNTRWSARREGLIPMAVSPVR